MSGTRQHSFRTSFSTLIIVLQPRNSYNLLNISHTDPGTVRLSSHLMLMMIPQGVSTSSTLLKRKLKTNAVTVCKVARPAGHQGCQGRNLKVSSPRPPCHIACSPLIISVKINVTTDNLRNRTQTIYCLRQTDYGHFASTTLSGFFTASRAARTRCAAFQGHRANIYLDVCWHGGIATILDRGSTAVLMLKCVF